MLGIVLLAYFSVCLDPLYLNSRIVISADVQYQYGSFHSRWVSFYIYCLLMEIRSIKGKCHLELC